MQPTPSPMLKESEVSIFICQGWKFVKLLDKLVVLSWVEITTVLNSMRTVKNSHVNLLVRFLILVSKLVTRRADELNRENAR